MAVVKRGRKYGVVIYDAGKQVWVGTFASKREALDAEAKASLERGGPTSSQTVREFAATWIERFPRPKRSTEVTYTEGIRAFASEFGGRRLRDLRRADLRGWAVEHPHSAAIARAMLTDAVSDEVIRENPLSGLRLPQSPKRPDESIPTADQVDTLCAAAIGAHGDWGRLVYAPMILVAAYTGMRPGEIHGLRWGDIDLASGLVHVARQYSPKANGFTLPKTGKTRTVELLARAREAIETIPRTSSEQVFTTKNGKLFTGKVSHYYWDPVRNRFGDPDLDFYTLRHFFGTLLASNGVGAPEIARAMGHDDGGKTALARYIHVGEREAWARVHAAVDGKASLRVVGEAS